MIAQFIEGQLSSWDELLSEISLAVNSSVADSTGFSPAFLMQGREPRLTAALYDEVTPGSATSALGPQEREGKLKEIFSIVHSNLQRAARNQVRRIVRMLQNRSRRGPVQITHFNYNLRYN